MQLPWQEQDPALKGPGSAARTPELQGWGGLLHWQLAVAELCDDLDHCPTSAPGRVVHSRRCRSQSGCRRWVRGDLISSSRGVLPRSQAGQMRAYALARLRSPALFAAESLSPSPFARLGNRHYAMRQVWLRLSRSDWLSNQSEATVGKAEACSRSQA